MKVCVLDPSYFTLPYDQHLCAGLRAAGVDVTLCGRPLRPGEAAHEHDYRIAARYYRFVERRGRTLLPASIRSMTKSAEHLWCTWRLGAWLRRRAFDVVHVQWAPIPIVDRWAWRWWRRSSALVFTVHDTEPFLGQATNPGQRMGWCGLLGEAERLFVHTSKSRVDLTGLGITAERITRVAHGPLYPILDGTAPETSDEARHGPRTILVFGEIKRYKGIDVLLRAAACIPRDMAAGWRILIAGRPRMDLGELQALAQQSAIPVDWRLGFVPDGEVAELFRSAEMIVFPYRNIDASGVLMMALPFRIPVVASRVGLFAEILEHGESALLVPPNDERALAAAMFRLMADAGLRAKFRAEIGRCLGEQYSWSASARAHVRAYEAVLAERDRRRLERGRATRAAAR